MEERKEIEEKIIQFLRQNPHGATGSEIAKHLGMNRVTVAKYLEVLRAEGLIDYKQVGRTKIWYLNEDIATVEVLKGRKDILKVLKRKDDNSLIILGGDLEFVLLPIEFIPDLYIEILKSLENGGEIIKNIGRRLGRQLVHIAEIYTGIKPLNLSGKHLESFIKQLVVFFLNLGWGKLKDFVFNPRKKELIVILEHSKIVDSLKEVEDPVLKKLKDKPVCYFLQGVFQGIMEAIYPDIFTSEERKCKFRGDEYCEFIVSI